MKKLNKIILVLIIATSIFLSSPVFAKNNISKTLTDEEKTQLNEIFEYRNVPLEKRQGLIDKLERGELWDSMKEEYSHIKPQVVKDGYSMTTYPDGSFLVVGIVDDITNESKIMKSELNFDHKIRALLSSRLINLGVEANKKDGLLEKFENGEMWDSFSGEYTDLKPQYKYNGFNKTVFPDGSVSLTYGEKNDSLEPYRENMTLQNGVKVASAYRDSGVVAIYYEVDYRQRPSTNEAEILSLHSYNARVVGGTYEVDTMGHEYGYKNPAKAWYAIYVEFYNSIAKRRYYVKFNVNGTQSWLEDNFYLYN